MSQRVFTVWNVPGEAVHSKAEETFLVAGTVIEIPFTQQIKIHRVLRSCQKLPTYVAAHLSLVKNYSDEQSYKNLTYLRIEDTNHH